MHCREMDVGLMRAKTARLSVAGELGYEINVPASEHLALHRTLLEAGARSRHAGKSATTR